MKTKVKATLSKINFCLNRNPKIIKYKNIDYRNYIPEPYKAVFLLSADFELAWAWHCSKSFQNPKQEAINRAHIERENIPKILGLCDEYDIPITWATVGHLFLEECSKDGRLAHPHLKRLPYHENLYWKFDRGDWFDDDPCTDWKTSPEWYAPDLVRMILDSKVKHEIACHTFSHIDCRDEVCPTRVLIGEIQECQNVAQNYGIKLESFVHPGHTIGNLGTLKKLGFSSFRTDYRNILGYPKKHSNGLWEFESTAELSFRKQWSLDYHIHRYIKIVERAIENSKTCYFWFHPSVAPLFIENVLPAVFEFIDSKREMIWVTNTQNYVRWLNDRKSIQ